MRTHVCAAIGTHQLFARMKAAMPTATSSTPPTAATHGMALDCASAALRAALALLIGAAAPREEPRSGVPVEVALVPLLELRPLAMCSIGKAALSCVQMTLMPSVWMPAISSSSSLVVSGGCSYSTMRNYIIIIVGIVGIMVVVSLYRKRVGSVEPSTYSLRDRLGRLLGLELADLEGASKGLRADVRCIALAVDASHSKAFIRSASCCIVHVCVCVCVCAREERVPVQSSETVTLSNQ